MEPKAKPKLVKFENGVKYRIISGAMLKTQMLFERHAKKIISELTKDESVVAEETSAQSL